LCSLPDGSIAKRFHKVYCQMVRHDVPYESAHWLQMRPKTLVYVSVQIDDEFGMIYCFCLRFRYHLTSCKRVRLPLVWLNILILCLTSIFCFVFNMWKRWLVCLSYLSIIIIIIIVIKRFSKVPLLWFNDVVIVNIYV